MKDLLVVSNGHGEDTIACSILQAMSARSETPVSLDCWPMVGAGDSYRARGYEIVGAFNRLPSEGFATLEARLMLRDIRAGWFATHRRQVQAARSMRGRYRMLLCVGDIVTMIAARLARTPFLFVGCAKSDFHDWRGRYNAIERGLLRRHAIMSYPRDRRTTDSLAAKGVPVRYLGNPMMDGLEGSGDGLGLEPDDLVIAMMPGSRRDAGDNVRDLLEIAAACAGVFEAPERLRFVFPLATALPSQELATHLADAPLEGWRVSGEQPGADESQRLLLHHISGAQALLVTRRFADALRRADIAIGMAGTANEQATGLGVPLICVPTRGAQGDVYTRMKARYFGDAAWLAPREPGQVAQMAVRLLADDATRARMRAAGHERMGDPGASVAIADEVLTALEQFRTASGEPRQR